MKDQCIPGFLSPAPLSQKLLVASPYRIHGLRRRTKVATISMTSSTESAIRGWSVLADKIPAPVLTPDYENGAPKVSPSTESTSLRLFGQNESNMRVVLYRDTAYWCPYCERVTLQLELAKIPYRIRKINMRCYGTKPNWYLQMVPSGLLPAAELDGRLITESLDIMFEINHAFPERSIIPSADDDKMQAFHRLVRLERTLAGSWLQLLRGPERLASKAKEMFEETLNLVDAALGEFPGPFFLGEEVTFIDCLFAPFMERIDSSVKYWCSIEIRSKKKIGEWFDAMEKWEPYGRLRSDDLTHVLALPPQIGPCRFSGERSRVSILVDRYRGLAVLNDGPEGRDARLEACGALIRNHDAVLQDALKGADVKEGDRQAKAAIDFGFWAVAEVLLDPDKLEELESLVLENIADEERDAVASATKYARQRCCVPRDMCVAASVQFYGGINWLIRTLNRGTL